MKQFLTGCAAFFFLTACNTDRKQEPPETVIPEDAPPVIGFSVVNTYPHDTGFYTEGLEFHEGQLFESSGSGVNLEEKIKPEHSSSFGTVNLKDGKVNRKVQLDSNLYFGEGITFLNGKLYQLTWKNHTGYIYDARSFKKLGEFRYPGEGWSLTHDSTHLIMSDGSSNLQFIDPASINGTIKAQSILGVTDNRGPVANINELEYVDGFIYANQYTTNFILKIDASNGKVVGKLDLSSLEAEAKKKNPAIDVLNGIAFHAQTNSFYITGKLWSFIYEIKLKPITG